MTTLRTLRKRMFVFMTLTLPIFAYAEMNSPSSDSPSATATLNSATLVLHEIATDAPAINDNGTPANMADDYYEIKTADDLFWFANQVNTDENRNPINGRLMNDINLNPG